MVVFNEPKARRGESPGQDLPPVLTRSTCGDAERIRPRARDNRREEQMPRPVESEGPLAPPSDEARFQRLFELAQIGVVLADAESNYTDANPTACRMLGYRREEFVKLGARDVIVQAQASEIEPTLREINLGADHRGEWTFRRKDGTHILVDVTATRFPDGSLLGMLRDVTALRAREREVARMTRLYAALSHVNQSIVWSSGRDELFPKVCRALVEHGGFRMAWIGWHDAETRRLTPVAEHGDAHGYLREVRVFTDDRPEGRGPSGTAFRTGRAYVCNDVLTDPAVEPWRAARAQQGLLSSATLPIRVAGVVSGTISVYAAEAGYFQAKEVALLEEVAGDISFALDTFAKDEARRRAERAVLGEKLFTDAMIESMPGILYFYDSDGRFLRWNRNFETASGYSASEIAGMHPRDFFSPSDRPLLDERVAEVFAKGESSLEADFVNRSGRSTPYLFTGRRIMYDGRPYLVGVGVDITDRTHMAAERERRHRAEEADRVKSAFLATMSHELRTPLNSIIGFTGILLQGLAGPLNDEQRKQLDMVKTSSRHLLALVNDVLDLSKIEAGQLEVAHDPFDLRRSVARVAGLVGPQATAKRLALRVEVAPSLGEAVGDARRVEQILLNLLSNAIKFTERGEVALTAEPAALERAGVAVPAVRVRVSDTGMGIRIQDMDMLFLPFRQIDSGLARRYDGTGLGLAICRRLATLLGGEIGVESAFGAGSTFRVTLPLGGPEAP